MTQTEVWLRGRSEGVPPVLLASMLEALPESEGTIPETLAGGALRLYAEVANGAGSREDALPLLAADALFTHAFEAQAEMNPEAIQTLVQHCQDGLGRIVP